jgi:hypothetical protein
MRTIFTNITKITTEGTEKSQGFGIRDSLRMRGWEAEGSCPVPALRPSELAPIEASGGLRLVNKLPTLTNRASRHESVAEEERHEHVKPLRGIQLVQIQPGQRRSGQAGSESCTCAGRPAR